MQAHARVRRRNRIILVQLLLVLAGTTAMAVSFGFDADCNSRYVWRGLAFSEGWVVQPDVWVSAGGATLTGWTSASLQGEDRYRFDEVDATASYYVEWQSLGIEPSVAAYVYPAGAPTSVEASVGLSYPLGPVSVTSNHSVELLSAPGAYFGDVGFEYSRDVICDRVAFDANAWTGVGSSRFNEANIGVSRFALDAAGIGVGVPVSWGIVTLRPHAEFSSIIDGVLREQLAADEIPVTNLSVGLSLGVEF
jgi:hypothetical protein